MKKCRICSIEKDESQFYIREGSKLRNECNECHHLRAQDYYQRNKEKRKQKAREWARNNKEKRKETVKQYINTPKGRMVKLMKMAHSRALKYGHEFDLDSDFLMSLWEKQNGRCDLTNISFEFINTTPYEANPWAPSIDRINSFKGYTKDNIRLVCVAVNYALNEYGEETFKKICEAYLNNKKSK